MGELRAGGESQEETVQGLQEQLAGLERERDALQAKADLEDQLAAAELRLEPCRKIAIGWPTASRSSTSSCA